MNTKTIKIEFIDRPEGPPKGSCDKVTILPLEPRSREYSLSGGPPKGSQILPSEPRSREYSLSGGPDGFRNSFESSARRTHGAPLELEADLAIIDSHINHIKDQDMMHEILSYIYDIILTKRIYSYTPLPDLKNKNHFLCTIQFQSVNIGTIELMREGKHKFFNITYSNPIDHDVYAREYHENDERHLVTTLMHNHTNVTLGLGYQHLGHNDVHEPNHVKRYVCQLSYSFNSIVLSDEINYLFLQDSSDSDIGTGFSSEPDMGTGIGSLVDKTDKSSNFVGYYIKEATFEDAVKSLLLLHLIVTKNTGNYYPPYDNIIRNSARKTLLQPPNSDTYDETETSDEETSESELDLQHSNKSQKNNAGIITGLVIGGLAGIVIAGLYCKAKFQ